MNDFGFSKHYYFGLEEQKYNVSTLGRRKDSLVSLLSPSAGVFFWKEENGKEEGKKIFFQNNISETQ